MKSVLQRKKEPDIKAAFTDGLLGEMTRLKNLGVNTELGASILSEIWVKRPPSVKEFFDEWFHEPLWPLQQEYVEAMVGKNPLGWNTEYDEGHGFWGKGCVSGDTILKDEDSGNKYSIRHMVENNIKINVKSAEIILGKYNLTVVPTNIPFLKGSTRLYKIKTKFGYETTVSKKHRVYTPEGWRKVEELGFVKEILSLNKGILKFDEIVSIEDNGVQDFYDIEVPKTHCYFAQNILHHNSGKDRTIAKLFAYILVKLLHLKNPQEGLNYFLGGGLGEDAPIDVINVSKDSIQAKRVFFKNLQIIMKKITNPETGRNFFEEQGADLRDTKDFQATQILLPHNITCHSLNSKEYTGEGLTTFFAVVDELGSFPIYSKADNQLTSIRGTIASRFPKIGKLCLISFKYEKNCPMTIEYKIGKKDPRVFSSKHATWEVNITKTKKNFSRQFTRNPDKAKMTYMCEETEGLGGYIRNAKAITRCLAKTENPLKGDIVSTSRINDLEFKKWFVGQIGKTYTLHVDLAKGKADGDAAGLVMTHPEMMFPEIDDSLKKELKEMGIAVKEEKEVRKGVVCDLALQLVAPPGGELILSHVRKFIFYLKTKLNFNIKFATYDRWQSLDSIQQLEAMGISAFELSVDKNEKPYLSLKELIYQGLLKGYPHPILNRELKELIKTEKGKIDHPDKSYERYETEGKDNGSKDVSDCLAGSSIVSMEKISTKAGFSFG